MMFAGLMVLTAGVTMAAAPASATSCNSWLNHKDIRLAPDEYQAGVECSDIDGDRKVRGQLNRNNATDKYTSYFTTEDKAYRTGWYQCLAGCTDEWHEARI
ncbi:hypothetical protein [Promicromonospora soli]